MIVVLDAQNKHFTRHWLNGPLSSIVVAIRNSLFLFYPTHHLHLKPLGVPDTSTSLMVVSS